MSSAGRAVSSSGCVGRPRGHETGLTGYAESIQYSSPTGSSAMETAEHREPYESRGSRTDLGAPGGENPPGDSTWAAVAVDAGERPQWVGWLKTVVSWWRPWGVGFDPQPSSKNNDPASKPKPAKLAPLLDPRKARYS